MDTWLRSHWWVPVPKPWSAILRVRYRGATGRGRTWGGWRRVDNWSSLKINDMQSSCLLYIDIDTTIVIIWNWHWITVSCAARAPIVSSLFVACSRSMHRLLGTPAWMIGSEGGSESVALLGFAWIDMILLWKLWEIKGVGFLLLDEGHGGCG